ncbi:MAG: FAD-dependent monooxygenase [Candidatus Aenigmarchaeota archaeon]|nr:FAD-dependent monooxygenase [Candidatus Aenigmarchaeota archaeon]
MRIGIVGCGINGAYLAYRLAKRHKVTVFEKKKVVGKDVCSGIVSKRLWNHIPKNENLIINDINEAKLHFPKKEVVLKFRPDMLILDRKKLDQYVASLAEKAGAEIKLGTEVDMVYNVKGMKPQVKVGKKVIEFDRLIGCDGFFSVVRKGVGIEQPKHRLGIYGYVKRKGDSKTVDIYPTENGFCWKIPRKGTVEFGVMEMPDVASKMYKDFCKKNRTKPKKTYSYVIPGGLVDAAKGNVALCGDAIGLTKPWSGGGVIWGLEAGDMLVKSFPNFSKYNSSLKLKFGTKIRTSRFARWLGVGLASKMPILAPKQFSFDSDWIF